MSRLLLVLMICSILASAHAASCAPWMILPAYDEVAISSEMNPIVCERCRLRPRAIALGRHPSSSTAAHTRSRVSCGMLTLGTLLTMKETVVCETPATRPTSYMEGGLCFDDFRTAAMATTYACTTTARKD